jgi:hypothetical protein
MWRRQDGEFPGLDQTPSRIRTTQTKAVAELLDMLSYKRPARSPAEFAFIEKFIKPLGPNIDRYGNLTVDVPMPDGTLSSVLWSCHTDTVHRTPGRQKLSLDAWPKVSLDEGGRAECLGADDAAGCWLMVQLVKANVPGLYIFHRDEEIGGLGSNWIQRNDPRRLDGILFAIALDRRATESIITHQGLRTCSDAFARSLASQLNDTRQGPGNWRLDDGGTFTDSANYTDLVGECTNLSVGYYREHTAEESLNIAHVLDLLQSLTLLDQSALMAFRKPGEPDDDSLTGLGWMDFYGREENDASKPIAYDRVWQRDARERADMREAGPSDARILRGAGAAKGWGRLGPGMINIFHRKSQLRLRPT